MEGFSIITKNISYIRARDPSIPLQYNVKKVRRNLVSQFGKPSVEYSEEIEEEEEEEDDDNIYHYQVYLRIKKVDHSELYTIKDSTTLLCKVPDGVKCIRNIHDEIVRTFKFSKIIDPKCTQTDVFNTIVKRKILSFLNGHNCTLMSYGASGSGKTFTMVGTAEDPGIIPHSLEYLFRTLPQLPELPQMKPTISGGVVYMSENESLKDRSTRNLILNERHINMDHQHHAQTYKAMQQRLSREPVGLIDENLGNDVSTNMWVSFAEIYNENIYDLLKPEPCRGQQRQKLRIGSNSGVTFIKGLTTVSVSSGLEAYLILQFGLHNLNYAATSLNEHSSRSHCIFTLQLVQASHIKKEVHVSVFNFCDLAGSERIKKTNNAGDRLKESNSINTSLLVLGRCIKLVSDKQKCKDSRLIPFRESKLTQLFQNALLGNEAVSMIVNINPTRDMFDETQHVLNFAAVAKSIVVEPPKIKPCDNTFSEHIRKDSDVSAYNDHKMEITKQICLLTDELQQQKRRNKEDRKCVVQVYKQMLSDTKKFWEDKYNKQANFLQSLEEEEEIKNKRSRLSIIVIDSSSDEEDLDDEQNEEILKSKIAELQSDINNLKVLKNEASAETLQLEDTLNSRRRDCLELKLKYETEVGSLKSHLLNISEQIKETKAYVDFKLRHTTEISCPSTDNIEGNKECQLIDIENCYFENVNGILETEDETQNKTF